MADLPSITVDELKESLAGCTFAQLVSSETCSQLFPCLDDTLSGALAVQAMFMTAPQAQVRTKFRWRSKRLCFTASQDAEFCGDPNELCPTEEIVEKQIGINFLHDFCTLSCGDIISDVNYLLNTLDPTMSVLIDRVSDRIRTLKAGKDLKITQEFFQQLRTQTHTSIHDLESHLAGLGGMQTITLDGMYVDTFDSTDAANADPMAFIEFINQLRCGQKCAKYDEMIMNCATFNAIFKYVQPIMDGCCTYTQMILNMNNERILPQLAGVKITLLDADLKDCDKGDVEKWIQDGEIFLRANGSRFNLYETPNFIKNACFVNECVIPNVTAAGGVGSAMKVISTSDDWQAYRFSHAYSYALFPEVPSDWGYLTFVF